MEALYWMIPVMFLCTILFAQYHPYITIALLALTLLFLLKNGVLLIFMRSSKKRSDSKRERRKKTVYARRCLLIMGGMFLVPSIFMLMKGLTSPSYAGMSHYLENPSLNNENYQLETILENNKETLKKFRDSDWKILSEQEKINVIKTVADMESEYLGVDCVEVVSDSLDFLTLGYYDPEHNIIKINRYYLINSSTDEILETIIHETYHLYQNNVVDSMGFEVEENKNYSSYYGDVRSWKQNINNYKSRFSDGYYTQPIEVSARIFAEQQLEVYKEFID